MTAVGGRARTAEREIGRPFVPAVARGLLQRKCACGGSDAEGECAECRDEREGSLQRSRTDHAAVNEVPPIVDEVLREPGQPLDSATRAFMEPRFGRDFSDVRVHTDARAAESARAVSALAYTVGQDVVFQAGKHDTRSEEGTRCLAHELTHVVQQTLCSHSGPASSDVLEFEARRVSEAIASGHHAQISAVGTAGRVQREEDKKALDAKAKAIIAVANDERTGVGERAEAVVRKIIGEYYAADKALVHSVQYNNAKAGTGVHAEEKFAPSSRNEESTGIVYVGDTFLKGVTVTHFARRVLQVGHEIEHIHQWRTGLAGGHKSSEREFLAFYHEALLPEKPGTGVMQHSTRLRLIDAALGNLHCLKADQQQGYDVKKKELLNRRSAEIAAGGTPDVSGAPAECKKSS